MGSLLSFMMQLQVIFLLEFFSKYLGVDFDLITIRIDMQNIDVLIHLSMELSISRKLKKVSDYS